MIKIQVFLFEVSKCIPFYLDKYKLILVRLASLFIIDKFLAFHLIFHVTYHIVLAIFVYLLICFFKRLKWIKLTEVLIV